VVFGFKSAKSNDPFLEHRLRMVADQIARRGVCDARVLEAMNRVPRHRFVPGRHVDDAYADAPLPIGFGQTVSQPYIVGFMIEALGLPDGGRVLEIGTGTGYQAAVLSETGYEVFTIEIIENLAAEAEENLKDLGYQNVHLRCSDGALGWPEEAPFDGIIAAAAPAVVPSRLLDQLAPDGVLVIPIGVEEQELWRYQRTSDGFEKRRLMSVRFVPMVGGEG
jgi:protein-L-isoaspartate(D-aspartate) O-methyltransferase